MHSYGGLLVPRGSKLALLKSTFKAENFIRRLYWSIISGFDAVQSWNVCGRPKSRKKFTKTLFCGARSFKVIDGGTRGKLVSSACYDEQQVCVYLQSSLARLDDSSRTRAFSRGYPNLMHSYGGLLQPRGSILIPFESTSTCNAEHFMCSLSWSMLNGFGAIHS